MRSACRGLCSAGSALPCLPSASPPAPRPPGRRAGQGRRRRLGPGLGGQLLEGELVRVALCCPLQSALSTPESRTESPRTLRAGERVATSGSGKGGRLCGREVCEFERPRLVWPRCQLEVQVWGLLSSSHGSRQRVPWYPPPDCFHPRPRGRAELAAHLWLGPQWDSADRAGSLLARSRSERPV